MVPSIYMYFVDTKSCLRMVFNIEHVHLLHQLFSSVHVQESEILTIKYLYKNYLLTYYTHKRDMSLRAVYILELQICKRLPKTQRFWKNMLCPYPKHLLSPRSFQNLLCLLVPTLSLLRSTGSWSQEAEGGFPHCPVLHLSLYTLTFTLVLNKHEMCVAGH
jgi:hypothetical protein